MILHRKLFQFLYNRQKPPACVGQRIFHLWRHFTVDLEYANAACVLENMALAATDMGIDNIIWGGAAAVVAQNDEFRKRLGIPEGFKPVLCASFGYASAEEEPKKHVISVNRV